MEVLNLNTQKDNLAPFYKKLLAKQPVYLIETSKTDLKPEDPDSVIEGWFTAEEVIKKLTFSDSVELFKKTIKYI